MEHRLSKEPEILLFEPLAVEKPWGGTRLARQFQKPFPTDKLIGESWEIADNEDGVTIVKDGTFQGQTLQALFEKDREALLGEAAKTNAPRFPLMLKLIDANDILSVQVHPNDAKAQELENLPFGKTEAWYVLDAEPDAWIIYGLKPGTTKADLRKAIAQGRIEELLQKRHVRRGDVIPVNAGTVHALGKGVLVAEIQQNVNVTYRLYDWGRVGADGKPRELHIEKAVEVIDESAAGDIDFSNVVKRDEVGVETLVANDCFVWKRMALTPQDIYGGDIQTFQIVLCVKGSIELNATGCAPVELRTADSALVPAAVRNYWIAAQENAEVLIAYTP